MVPVVDGHLALSVLGDGATTHNAVAINDVRLFLIVERDRTGVHSALDVHGGDSSLVVEHDVIAESRIDLFPGCRHKVLGRSLNPGIVA